MGCGCYSLKDATIALFLMQKITTLNLSSQKAPAAFKGGVIETTSGIKNLRRFTSILVKNSALGSAAALSNHNLRGAVAKPLM